MAWACPRRGFSEMEHRSFAAKVRQASSKTENDLWVNYEQFAMLALPETYSPLPTTLRPSVPFANV